MYLYSKPKLIATLNYALKNLSSCTIFLLLKLLLRLERNPDIMTTHKEFEEGNFPLWPSSGLSVISLMFISK